jgi:hypothetical protein
MAYDFFRADRPDPVNNAIVTVFTDTRKNFEAVRDGVVVGFPMQWEVTPYASAAGTLDQPTSVIAQHGQQIVKMKNVWGTVGGEDGNVTQQRFTYSSDGGSSYVSMGVYDFSYNASGIFTGMNYTSVA